MAMPARTERAAVSASSVSLLPSLRRLRRSQWLTSTTRIDVDQLRHPHRSVGGSTLSSSSCRPAPPCRPRLGSVPVDLRLRDRWGEWHPQIPPSNDLAFALVSDPVTGTLRRCWISTPAKALVDGHFGRRGAGGNRTALLADGARSAAGQRRSDLQRWCRRWTPASTPVPQGCSVTSVARYYLHGICMTGSWRGEAVGSG